MRKTFFAYFAVAAMLGSIFLFPATSATPTPLDITTEVIGGRTWTSDIRVTRNGGQDHVPQITVDSDHDAHILWQSTRSPSGYYYVKLNRQGELLSTETFISSKILTSWGPQYVYGPTIDIDSQENLHVVFDFDYQNVGYAKFDYQGNELVAEKKVGPVDGASSHTPSVAVGTDDTVHISNEDYKFQCEDDVYHKLANDGTEIWSNRVVSSDVATHVEFDLIKVSRFSGNILFTFGSSTGTWLGRMDKYGVKSMASVKIRPETDYKIADVAETPNGDMHLVWFDPTTGGKIHYTRVNGTGVKMQDNIIISPNAQNAGMPRIAATGSGLAVVVWEDRRNGNMDVYYSVIENILFSSPTEMTLPENIRLTQQGNDQTEPWIAIDPDDNFHVAWTDMRDGNQEIYYKFMFNFALELYADPIDVANMFFIHPNETKRLTMFVKNKGGLVDGYTLDLSYSQGATQDGWRIDIDTTQLLDIQAGQVSSLNLTVHAPSDAIQGDHINMTINASSNTAPSSWDSIEINTFVQVTRSLLLNTGQNLKTGDNGETLQFAMVATNTGDVIEPSIDVLSGEAQAPTGWFVSVDKLTLSLEPQQTDTFTVTVVVPEDTGLAPANMLARIGVTIRSGADSTVTASREILVQVKANFFIQMTSSAERIFVDPGANAVYTISISNIGNLASQAQINLEAQQPSQSGWAAVIDRDTIFLRGGETTAITLTVTAPANAVANSRLSIVVSAFAPRFGTTGMVPVVTLVNRVYGMDVSVGASGDVKVGRAGSFPVTITNTGNGDETLRLVPYLQEPGWSMSFAQSSVEVTSVFVPHGETRTFDARVQTDAHALAGLHVPVMNIIDEGTVSHYVPLPTRVIQFFAVDVTAQEFKLSGSPLKTLQYDLEVRNLGNGPDNFTMSLEPLDVNAWDARFFLVIDPVNDTQIPSSTVALSGGGSAHVRLLITVPRATEAQEVQFTASATSASGEVHEVILVAQVRLADLVIDRVDYSPTTPVAGEITAITIAVANAGDIEANPVRVEFYDQGSLIATDELIRVAGGQKGYVTFAWLPTPGHHDLRFVVDPATVDPITGLVEPNGLVFEKNELDNERSQPVDVGATQNFLPGFDAAFALAGVAVVAVALVGRRKRN